VFGEKKQNFFDEVDVLVFPTKYKNEAEPLTILEAMRSGIPVIACDRGAIREILTPSTGLVVESADAFQAQAFQQIVHWLSSPSIYFEASSMARDRFAALRDKSLLALGSLIRQLCHLEHGE
jgi:glycosyltransferase involved in cell wall biosynthesis